MRLISYLSTLLVATSAQLPDGWWNDSKGIHVRDFDHFKELAMSEENSTYAEQHIFIDFFME